MTSSRSPVRALAIGLALSFAALPAAAACEGRNQITLLSPADRAALVAAVDVVPFARGNLWRATRGDQVLIVIGTLHIDDPRHAATMARLAPWIDGATTVLVEAGPQEEARLQADLARDPTMTMRIDGPTLPETLPPETWEKLKQALRARSVPPFVGARMQPAYLAMLLGIPPCAMDALASGKTGLDRQVIDRALASGVAIRALEPYDTLFRAFDGLTPDDERAFLDVSITLADEAEDSFATMLDSYFAEDSRTMWELSRQQALAASNAASAEVDAGFARMEAILMTARNHAWMPVIEDALTSGPAVAAFGALHLSGQDGVLELLRRAGFRLERLPF